MKVLLAASEVHPFAKTGGLADVAGALPRALADLGVEVAVCLPFYRKVRRRSDRLEVVAERVDCTFAGSPRPFRLLRTTLPGCNDVAVYLIENPGVFEAEDALYGTEPGSYGDGHLRFLYFSKALLHLPRAAEFLPDVIHLNDWQTALAAPLLRTLFKDDADLSRAACVLTIHNLAYQGVFPAEDLRRAGIPDFLLREGRLLEKGEGNMLAGGIRFADALSTVSRSYADEILTPEFGCGLEAVLLWRKRLLRGIVNGLDTETWNPATDPNLPVNYDAEHLEGKRRCRAALLRECSLAECSGPVFGIVSRLVAQKGLGLVLPVMEDLLESGRELRLVVLGSGEPALEQAFQDLSRRFPGRVHARLTFDAAFASRVEAGADFFLMPSRFEPCGLNQLISMRYGTPPIVRRVGGLKDTVTDATPENLRLGKATGFTFETFDAGALAEAVARALLMHASSPADYRSLQLAGMTSDLSWRKSAGEYLELYRDARFMHAEGSHLRPLLEGLPREPLGVELPWIPPPPEHYDRDVLTVLPRSPDELFVRFEISTATLAERARAGAETSEFDLVLVVESGEDPPRVLPVARHGWRFVRNLAPGRTYRVSLQVRPREGSPQPGLGPASVTMPADVWPEFL